jgi:SAM-dependent methyltransferase
LVFKKNAGHYAEAFLIFDKSFLHGLIMDRLTLTREILHVTGQKTPEANVPDYYNKSRKEVLQFIPETCKRLLDVGCRAGAFGALIKETFDAEVWGVDPSPLASERATEVLDHFIHGFFQKSLSYPNSISM